MASRDACVSGSLGVYFAARTLMGLGSGGIWIGVTFDTLERWPGQEYVCMSRVFAAYSVGGLIGPALGAFGGIHGPFLVYLALLLLAVPVVLFVTPAAHRDFSGDAAVLRTRAFWIASAAILFASLALGVLEGVLPLHLAERVTQAQIGALYVGASLVVATSATVSGGRPPGPLVIAAVVLSVAGIALAGIATDVPLWVLGLLLAALGIGLGNTGSLGLLVDAVPVERIVTAMVVWSQIGIIGYLLGPLTGGVVAERAGYDYVWLIPAAAALIVLALTRRRVTRMSDIQLNDPQTLYRHWEDQQWSRFDVDLSTDHEQWPRLEPSVREILYFALSSLMVAEERITTKFAGLVAAHAPEEETTFLATQQVDEARHMQFYARFRDEVIAEPQVIAAHVERAGEQVSDSFRELFDGALVELHHELVANPGDLAAKVRFITLYHLVLEATLGLTTFKFVTDYLNAEGLLPGFVEGYSKIHHDETRHIGYGVWFLRKTVRDHPEAAHAVRETLRALLPTVAESLKPPGDGNGSGELLGVTPAEIREFALGGLTRRLKLIGVPLETVFVRS